MDLIYILGAVCAVYFSTNLDNLLCLIGFFSNRTIKTTHVFAGWFVGSLLIIFVSLTIAYIGSSVISEKHIGLLGILPLLIGLKGLYNLYQTHQKKKAEKQASTTQKNNDPKSKSHIITGAAVTLANGGDNISAYAPLFLLARNPHNILLTVIMFVFMTASFSVLGYWVVRKNNILGKSISEYGTIALPFVLIFLGFSILYQSFWN